MNIEVNGKSIETDAEGYFLNLNDRDEDGNRFFKYVIYEPVT